MKFIMAILLLLFFSCGKDKNYRSDPTIPLIGSFFYESENRNLIILEIEEKNFIYHITAVDLINESWTQENGFVSFKGNQIRFYKSDGCIIEYPKWNYKKTGDSISFYSAKDNGLIFSGKNGSRRISLNKNRRIECY